MSIGYVGALRFLHRTFRRYPASHRLHMLIRFLTCPFLRTLDVLPRGGRVMDIGAGHGLYAALAIHEGVREVIAVEPDVRKSLLPLEMPGIRKVAGFDECMRGEFDAIVVYDATYRMPIDYRAALYRRIFDRLKPGGTFILKDMDPDRTMKMAWARFQEWLSDTFLGVSIGSGFIYQSRADVERALRGIGFEDFRAQAIDRGYPHSHIVYTARRGTNAAISLSRAP
ncbi:MAG TPA: methyltransferase domain-containing protein [Thermoanaerobaculia bacterium]|nr:methyltransferase domain-containing protein [Thermoanaerobaculia bacterium]